MATYTVQRTKVSDGSITYLCVTNDSNIVWGDPKIGGPTTYYYVTNTLAVMSIFLWVLQHPTNADETYTYSIRIRPA